MLEEDAIVLLVVLLLLEEVVSSGVPPDATTLLLLLVAVVPLCSILHPKIRESQWLEPRSVALRFEGRHWQRLQP